MKYLMLVLALFFTSEAWGGNAHVVSKEAGIDITTKKVIHFQGDVDSARVFTFGTEGIVTYMFPGDRVILITSHGGMEDAGRTMISMMQAEQSQGVKTICIADGYADSMAFNLMSFCDVRLATKKTTFLVHKVESDGPPMWRHTAKFHRQMAEYLDQLDEPYRQRNAHAMHLNLDEYDKAADDETSWTADQLVKIGYLQGFATVTDDTYKK